MGMVIIATFQTFAYVECEWVKQTFCEEGDANTKAGAEFTEWQLATLGLGGSLAMLAINLRVINPTVH